MKRRLVCKCTKFSKVLFGLGRRLGVNVRIKCEMVVMRVHLVLNMVLVLKLKEEEVINCCIEVVIRAASTTVKGSKVKEAIMLGVILWVQEL